MGSSHTLYFIFMAFEIESKMAFIAQFQMQGSRILVQYLVGSSEV
jgi:hypothetical protein